MDKSEVIKILTEIEQAREKPNHGCTDHCFRVCAAIVASAAGFAGRADWEPLTRGEEPPVRMAEPSHKIDWAKIAAGEIVEIDKYTFDYFLDVLPPAFQGRTVTLMNGKTVHASYGFVEGADRITAFFKGQGGYFAAGTTLFSRG